MKGKICVIHGRDEGRRERDALQGSLVHNWGKTGELDLDELRKK